MDWTRAVNAYCERTGPEYWSESLNAVTNLAFVVAAGVMWQRCPGLVLVRVMCILLAAIGVGSFLFHTYAQVWAGAADVLPIALFILLYLFAMNRHGLELRTDVSLFITALFVPYAALTVPLFERVPGLGSSAGYAPVPVLIAVYAVILRRRKPALSRGLAIGAALLVVSIVLRALDMPLCPAWPQGTHFVWHLLNGLLLGWLIAVYRRARLGKPGTAR